jgi:hypothetical protein
METHKKKAKELFKKLFREVEKRFEIEYQRAVYKAEILREIKEKE